MRRTLGGALMWDDAPVSGLPGGERRPGGLSRVFHKIAVYFGLAEDPDGTPTTTGPLDREVARLRAEVDALRGEVDDLRRALER
jgi:hypothetical protein